MVHFQNIPLDKIPKSVTVLSEIMNFFLQKVIAEKTDILNFINERIIHFSNGDSDSLSQIDWKKTDYLKLRT